MQLRTFTAGLNTRLAPQLINPAESVKLHNVDITAGILQPIKGLSSTNIKSDKYFYGWRGEWFSSIHYRDYLEYRDLLLWTEEGTYPKKYDGKDIRRLGIVKPSNKLKLTVTEAPTFDAIEEPQAHTIPNVKYAKFESTSGGDLTPGEYEYAFINKEEGITSKPYEVTATVNDGDSALKISSFEGVEGTVYIYRKYNDEYRLVGSTSDDYTDDTLDISSNEVLTEKEIFPLGAFMDYAYDVYDEDTELRHQEFRYLTLSSEEKTYKITLGATASKPVKLYRKYEDEFIEISEVDDTYEISGEVKPPEEKYLSGIYQYCYTYYNEEDGTESQPSEYSDEVDINNGIVYVEGLESSSDEQVTHKQLYRMGGTLTVMSRVLTTTAVRLTDNYADVDIDGYILDSFNNKEAPTGLLYLTEAYAIFFGALKDKLCFSEIGNPNYWSEYNFIDFDADITGIGVVPNGLIIFTKLKTYIITGTNSSTFVKHLVSGEQGCLSHKSIQYAQNSLIWASNDGLCATVGGEVKVVTQFQLGKLVLEGIEQSAVYDEVYYVLHSEGMLALDFRYGNSLYTLDFNLQYMEKYQDELYGYKEGYLYKLFQGEPVEWSYISGDLVDGAATVHKLYNDFYVAYEGYIEGSLYIDDLKVADLELESESFAVADIAIPQQFQRGYKLKIALQGTGKVHEIEYKIVGRQNGK